MEKIYKSDRSNRQNRLSSLGWKCQYYKIMSKCQTCMHYLKDKMCAAFLELIPDYIWSGRAEHNTGRMGQLLEIVYEGGGILDDFHFCSNK